MDALSGIVFLGAPHFSTETKEEDVRKVFNFLFTSNDKGAAKMGSEGDEIKILVDICQGFTPLNMPIVSAYELKPTVKRRRFLPFVKDSSYVVCKHAISSFFCCGFLRPENFC